MKLRYRVIIQDQEFAYFRFGSDAEKCVMNLRSNVIKNKLNLKEYNIYMENV
jgi:hypothetical protein